MTRTVTLDLPELDALHAVLEALRRGTHPRDIEGLLRSEAVLSVSRKVQAMRHSIVRQRAIGLRIVRGG